MIGKNDNNNATMEKRRSIRGFGVCSPHSLFTPSSFFYARGGERNDRSIIELKVFTM
jgi:hypothetical protein